MPKLFRQVRDKRNKWIWYEPRPRWLEEGDIPAGPLVHLIPGENRLSVYEVNDEPARIHQVATALAAGRANTDVVEYFVFDESILLDLGIEIDKLTPGTTCDSEVNKWHRDLINFSANKMVAFAKRALPIVVSDFVPKKTIDQKFLEVCRSRGYDWSKIGLENKQELRKQCEDKASS